VRIDVLFQAICPAYQTLTEVFEETTISDMLDKWLEIGHQFSQYGDLVRESNDREYVELDE
jgi:hypothetical protein